MFPTFNNLLQDHVAGKLDISLFPYVKDAPSATPAPAALQTTTSLRSQKPVWHRAARPGGTSETRQRIMVFVAGGMTYSEVREVYQLSTSLNKDIYIGNLVFLAFLECVS
jgi:syntaxin-binding protein 1